MKPQSPQRTQRKSRCQEKNCETALNERVYLNYSNISLFDLDKTLVVSNSSFAFGAFLYKKKIITKLPMMYFAGTYLAHHAGVLSLHGLHQNIFQGLFRGRSYHIFEDLANEFLGQYLPQCLCPSAYQKLQEAKRNGDYTVILSSSPDFLVAKFANYFAVDEWKATAYSVNPALCFESISSIMTGNCKAEYTLALAQRLKVPLSQTTAYSDSYLDLPFLEKAGKAIVVRPSRKLRGICHERLWEIIE